MRAKTPKTFFEDLAAQFPGFQAAWPVDEDIDTIHHVLAEFTVFFGTNAHALSKKQLMSLAGFINSAVLNNDTVENAVSTCFLEHLHQVDRANVLRPFLTHAAKRKMHAYRDRDAPCGAPLPHH